MIKEGTDCTFSIESNERCPQSTHLHASSLDIFCYCTVAHFGIPILPISLIVFISKNTIASCHFLVSGVKVLVGDAIAAIMQNILLQGLPQRPATRPLKPERLPQGRSYAARRHKTCSNCLGCLLFPSRRAAPCLKKRSATSDLSPPRIRTEVVDAAAAASRKAVALVTW